MSDESTIEDDDHADAIECWNCGGDGGGYVSLDDMGCGDYYECSCGDCVWRRCTECFGRGFLR